MMFEFIFSTRFIKRQLQFVLLAKYLFISACIGENSSPTIEINFDKDDDVVQVENWQFLGPFSNDSTNKEDPIDIDFLSLVSSKEEAQINESDILEIANANTSLKSGLITSKAQGINILDYVEKKEGTVYLFCTIKAQSDLDVNILFNGMQNAKLWLNNEFLYETKWKRVQYKYYEEYLPVKLKKGNNALLLKLVFSDSKSSSHWKFNLFASTEEYAKNNYLKDYRFSVLTESIIDERLVAYLGPFINETIDYKIFNNESELLIESSVSNRSVKEGTISIDTDSLKKNALYRIDFNIIGNIISQDFYYGDFDLFIDKITKQYKTVSNNNISKKDKLNLEASFKRLQHLKDRNNTSETPTSVKAYWDRSRVLFGKELSVFFENLPEKDSNHINQFDGLIKSYISKIDASKQYYSSYIPEKLKQEDEKIPLIIFCPFSYTPTPYLESWYTSNLEQDMWDSNLADEYGFGIVWADFRGHPGLNEIAMTAFQEILEDIKSDINIDEDRIFIVGNSSSSRKALTLATRFPTLIAGSVFYGPDIDFDKFNENGYNIKNLFNTNLFVRHSKRDEVVPLEAVKQMYEKMQHYSNDPVLKLVDNSTHYVTPKDSYRSAFEYLKDKRRNPKPDSIILSTSELKYGESNGLRLLEKQEDGVANIKVYFDEDTIQINSQNVNRFELDLKGRKVDAPVALNGRLLKKIFREDTILDVSIGGINDRFPLVKNNSVEGPLNHAFASNFKIVYNNKDASIKDTLNKLWKKVYFNDVLSSKDIDVTMQDIDNSNLILIGAEFNNKTIQLMVDQLPIKIFEDYILFRGRRFDGKNVFISFVYPNPINPDKYIVLIVSNGKLRSIPIKDFSNDGKSDFMIFNYVGDRYQLSSSGNFDNNWQ